MTADVQRELAEALWYSQGPAFPSWDITAALLPTVQRLIADAEKRAAAAAYKAAANRLTIDHPQAALNWCADQARIALGQEPYHSAALESS